MVIRKNFSYVIMSGLLVLFFLAGTFARVNTNGGFQLRNEERAALESSNQTAAAARSVEVEEALSKHAVDDPEEVASMVVEKISVWFYQTTLAPLVSLSSA